MRTQEIPVADGKLVIGFAISGAEPEINYQGELEINDITYMSDDYKTNIDVLDLLTDLDNLSGGDMIMSTLKQQCWDGGAEDVNPMED